jgi:hypothetical protein
MVLWSGLFGRDVCLYSVLLDVILSLKLAAM